MSKRQLDTCITRLKRLLLLSDMQLQQYNAMHCGNSKPRPLFFYLFVCILLNLSANFPYFDQMHLTVPSSSKCTTHSVPASNFHLFAKCCSSRGCTQQAPVAYFDRTVTDQRTFFHALQNLPAMQCVRPNKNCPSQILQPFCPNRL